MYTDTCWSTAFPELKGTRIRVRCIKVRLRIAGRRVNRNSSKFKRGSRKAGAVLSGNGSETDLWWCGSTPEVGEIIRVEFLRPAGVTEITTLCWWEEVSGTGRCAIVGVRYGASTDILG